MTQIRKLFEEFLEEDSYLIMYHCVNAIVEYLEEYTRDIGFSIVEVVSSESTIDLLFDALEVCPDVVTLKVLICNLQNQIADEGCFVYTVKEAS